MEIKQEDFDRFIQWLKNEGVKIKLNERWWRQRIFERLLNDDPMTLENWNAYQDNKFLDNPELLSIQHTCDPFLLIGLTVKFKGGSIKKIEKVIDTNSHIHLFFDDYSDELISRDTCYKILNLQHS